MKVTPQQPNDVRRCAGSFRDPSGFVFTYGGRVFRSVDDSCHQVISDLVESGVLDTLVDHRDVVGTQRVEDSDVVAEFSGRLPVGRFVLEHEVLWPITYPYEWSVSMLADAGIHTLNLQMKLLSNGHTLKDASAYNIQFQNGQPIFIDIASIETNRQGDFWYALGQFQRMFTYPILLVSRKGWDVKSVFLSRIDGCAVDDLKRCFNLWERWSPQLLLDYTLPMILGSRVPRKPLRSADEGMGKSVAGHPGLIWNLRRLRQKVERLAATYRPQSVWHNYEKEFHQETYYRQAKKQLVDRFLRRANPCRVLDAGCNTGEYSLLAAELGSEVVAVDSDHDCVESLYRKIRGQRFAITPLVVDLANPSPAIGYLNQERLSFFDRLDTDCVLALGLVHHLLVNANLSLANMAKLFDLLTTRYLVLEFVPPQDDLFQRLTCERRDSFGNISLAACRKAFTVHFELIEEQALSGSERTLLFFCKR